jgi:hypothetical protein
MWQTIEEFCTAHQHTIAAFAAASTFAAVVTTLALKLPRDFPDECGAGLFIP